MKTKPGIKQQLCFQGVYRDFMEPIVQKRVTVQTMLRATRRTEDVVVSLAGEVADAIKVGL